MRDGTETDIDCGGGICSPCVVGKKCQVATDCTSNACDALSLTCVSSQCADHRPDGAETDIDCGGGACAPCTSGQKCQVDSDCTSNACDVPSFTCVPNQCADHRQDGAETDMDCGGGTCPPCGANKKCKVDADCAIGACDALSLLCLVTPCADHQQDGAETDVDCGGGTCAPCAIGKRCKVDADCTSNACDALTLTCVPSQCADHRQDGAETDVDCGGGTCAHCAVSQKCKVDTDCSSNACDPVALTCVSINGCSDHQQDGAETDVDCGGGICAPCTAGQKCNLSADCLTGLSCSTTTPHVCM
jgi:hypothetical protein